jgi:hypothetical protein
MKITGIAGLLFVGALGLAAQQTPSAPAGQTATAPRPVGVSPVLADLQRTLATANDDISRLRIEKWKCDSSQKQQMNQVAQSLQRNITGALPGLISDAQNQPNSVAKSFKLYHDINIVYEFLNSLAEAAGAFGKNEEYEPLARDAATLDNVRQNLSSVIEQASTALETQLRQATAAPVQVQAAPPKKIIVDDAPQKAAKKTTKKKSSPTPPPAPPGNSQ